MNTVFLYILYLFMLFTLGRIAYNLFDILLYAIGYTVFHLRCSNGNARKYPLDAILYFFDVFWDGVFDRFDNPGSDVTVTIGRSIWKPYFHFQMEDKG